MVSGTRGELRRKCQWLDAEVLLADDFVAFFRLGGDGQLGGGAGQLVAQALAVLDHAAHQQVAGVVQRVLHALGGFLGAHGQRAAAQGLCRPGPTPLYTCGGQRCNARFHL